RNEARFAAKASEAVLTAARRPPSNEDSRTDRRARRLGGLRRSFVTGPAERPARKEAAMALRGKAIAASLLLISGSAGGGKCEQSRRLSVNQEPHSHGAPEV